MRIVGTTVRMREPEAGAVALAALLGLVAERDDAGPFVRIGWTTVRPVEHSGDDADHLAILIPGDAYPAAKAWLLDRTPALLCDGEVDLLGPPGWDSTSIYFDGPDGVVLELIAHTGHRVRGDPGFGPSSLLGVCEVGVAVPDVLAAAEAVAEVALAPFAQQPSPGFTPVGDFDGRLILVPPGRTWFPTTDRTAGLASLSIEATVGRSGSVRLGDTLLTAS